MKEGWWWRQRHQGEEEGNRQLHLFEQSSPWPPRMESHPSEALIKTYHWHQRFPTTENWPYAKTHTRSQSKRDYRMIPSSDVKVRDRMKGHWCPNHHNRANSLTEKSKSITTVHYEKTLSLAVMALERVKSTEYMLLVGSLSAWFGSCSILRRAFPLHRVWSGVYAKYHGNLVWQSHTEALW